MGPFARRRCRFFTESRRGATAPGPRRPRAGGQARQGSASKTFALGSFFSLSKRPFEVLERVLHGRGAGPFVRFRPSPPRQGARAPKLNRNTPRDSPGVSKTPRAPFWKQRDGPFLPCASLAILWAFA